MRFRKSLVVLAGGLLGAMLVSAPVAASGATVIIERGGSSCSISPGDIPGLTHEFQADSSTVTITPTGMLVVTCTGRLPADFQPERTLVLDILCTGDFDTSTGHLIATTGGRLSVMCRFPAG
jgi:hypothetical protein